MAFGVRVKGFPLFSASGTGAFSRPTEQATAFKIDPEGIPVAFEKRAFVITHEGSDDGFDRFTFQPLQTRYPVLRLLGANADRTMIAYTSLALSNAEGVTTDVEFANAASATRTDLVPSGRLILERPDGSMITIVGDGADIVAAAWHPTDPYRIAFSGYMEDGRGTVGVYDVRTNASEDVIQGDLAPELLLWGDDGVSLGVSMESRWCFVRSASVNMRCWYGIGLGSAGVDGSEEWGSLMTFEEGHLSRNIVDPAFALRFEQGGSVAAPDGWPGGELRFTSEDGSLLSMIVSPDQLQYMGRRGFAYVFDDPVSSGACLAVSDGSIPLQRFGWNAEEQRFYSLRE